MSEFDLGYGYLGNGLTVWNRAAMEHGDYKTVAHISNGGNVCYYMEQIPDDVKRQIENAAEREREKFAANFEKRVKIDTQRLYYEMLDRLTFNEREEHFKKKSPGYEVRIDDIKGIYFQRV